MRRTASGASCPVSTLIGRPLADERGKGREGKPGGFPLAFLGTRGDLGAARVEAYLKEEGGRGGKTCFPPRERAEDERRSFSSPIASPAQHPAPAGRAHGRR